MKDKVIKALVDRLNYPSQRAELLWSNLARLDEKLMPILVRWLDSGDGADQTQYEGYCVDSLRKNYGMNTISALLTLDWIIKEPEQAVAALRDGIM